MRTRTRNLRIQYEIDLARQSKLKPKVIWDYINKKTKIKTSIGDLYINQETANSPKTENDLEKAEILSDYFSNVFVIEPEGQAIPKLPRLEVQYAEQFTINTEDTKKTVTEYEYLQITRA